MKIEKAKISDLKSPSWNPRDITPEDMEKLENSIKEFGYVDPIIVNDHTMNIVGGNQRFVALKNLGYDEVDVIFIHEEDLNREKALNVALNKISGDWDNKLLGELFNELSAEGFDLELTGFDEFELDFYLDDGIEFDNPFDYDDYDDYDEDDELPEDFADVEGDNSETQYVCYISFETQDEANEFLKWLNAPYEMNKTSVGLNSSEITWGNQE